MRDKVMTCFIYLMNAIQAGKIYSTDHPKFKDFLDRLHALLQEILQERKELTLGIVNGELAWEDEIFFNLSTKLGALINFLEESGIERIVLEQGLRYEDLHKFIIFLARTRKLQQVDEKEYFALHGIQNIRAGRLRVMVKSEGLEAEKTELQMKYENSLQAVSHSLNLVLDEEEIDYLDLRFNVLNIMEDFVGRHQELLNLISVKHKDLLTFVHLLNVSLLAMFFASKLGFSKEDILDLGIAALYHDIGKLYISQKIIQKKTKLAEQEFIQIRDHPLLGAKILDAYKNSMGILPLVVAFEHHLRYDLGGYPKLDCRHQPHLASLLVSICDVYDALALKRSYKRNYPPDKIYEMMMMERGKMFDPFLLDKFFQFLGVWPVGTLVSLSDGRIAVVREVHEQDVFRPTVDIIIPENQRERIDLCQEKNLSIDEALNPHGQGKKYLPLLGESPSQA